MQTERRRAHQNDSPYQQPGIVDNSGNPLEHLDRLNLTSEERHWAAKWWSRGRLRLNSLKSEASIRWTKFRHFVGTHEVGHKRLVHRTGHRLLEIDAMGGGGVEGHVSYQLARKRSDEELLYDMAIIKLGGLVITGSYYGTGSDLHGVDQVAGLASQILGQDTSSFISVARARAEMGVGSRDSAEHEAFDYIN